VKLHNGKKDSGVCMSIESIDVNQFCVKN